MIIAENFPNPGKETDIEVQDRVSSKMKMKPKGPHQDILQLKYQKLKINREL